MIINTGMEKQIKRDYIMFLVCHSYKFCSFQWGEVSNAGMCFVVVIQV